jgi:DNA-binding PucR family transcriptional regulator
VAAKLDDAIYAVIPLPDTASPGSPDPGVRAFVVDFLRRHAPKQHRGIVVGLGGSVASVAELRRSQEQSARVLAVLRARPAQPTAVADIIEVGAQALLLHVSEALSADPSLGAAGLQRLREYDEEKSAQFVATVRAWLDAFGDTDIAAAVLNVHPNTVRYRVRQLRELGLVDLDDPDARLALQLHLRRG